MQPTKRAPNKTTKLPTLVYSACTRKIRLANGISLDCRETGDPRGEPVILLHGVTDSHFAWRPFIEELPRGLHIFALSMRGHGHSDKPLESYDAAAFAGDLAAFMDAVGLPRAHICAHSMGAWIAQRFATDYPTRVTSLSLIGGFVTLRGNPAVASMPADLLDMGPVIDPGDAGVPARTLAREVEPDFLEMVVGESLKAPAHVWRACFDAMMATPAKARAFRTRRCSSLERRMRSSGRRIGAPSWRDSRRPSRSSTKASAMPRTGKRRSP